jgi:hypothetical protein
VKISFLATMTTLTAIALLGCDGGSTAEQPEAFELDGTWVYLGPWDGEHMLEISNKSMVYAAIAEDWSSDWSIEQYDNGLHRFRIAFESGTGTYLPVGQNMSGAYVLSGEILTVQLSDDAGSYPPVESPGSCTTEDSELIPDCRIYMHQN